MYRNTKHFKETCYATAEYLEWSTCSCCTIGCGCCTYGCPAKRPLMQLFKTTKAEIMAMKKR